MTAPNNSVPADSAAPQAVPDLSAVILALAWVEPAEINEEAEDDTELTSHREGWMDCRKAAAALVSSFAAPVAQAVPVASEWTQAQISAAGRVLADISALSCGVDKDDNWKVYSDEFMEEARLALAAAGRVK